MPCEGEINSDTVVKKRKNNINMKRSAVRIKVSAVSIAGVENDWKDEMFCKSWIM